MPVDSIEQPIVLLKDNSVVRVSLENYPEVKGKVQKILFLGDMLIDFGDFLYCNKALPPPATWRNGGQKTFKTRFSPNMALTWEKPQTHPNLASEKLEGLLLDPFQNKPTVKDAILLSQTFGVPLAPNCLLFWTGLNPQEVEVLQKWLARCDVLLEDGVASKIAGPAEDEVVTLLRKIFIPHKIVEGNVMICGADAAAFGVHFRLWYRQV